MGLLNQIATTFSEYFNGQGWIALFTDPVSWGLIGTLIIMEGLLSSDNALVLASMVKHLPGKQKKTALFAGLIGSYAFRFIAIGLGTALTHLWWVKDVGAAYLGWLVVKYFIEKSQKDSDENQDGISDKWQKGLLVRMFGQFWATVVMVEGMDIAFSSDSVLAAFGVSSNPRMLLIGGMLGVLMMRGVAQLFLVLLDKVPEFETTAYVLIAIISIKMFIESAHVEVPQLLFFAILAIAFCATFIVHGLNVRKEKSKAKITA